MIKWYLVLYILGQGSAMITIPTPYQSEQDCNEAGKKWINHLCIKVDVQDDDKGYVCQPGASECQVVK